MALLVVSVTQYVRAGQADFRLYNRTGVDIYHLYISPTATDDWEEDVLNGNVLVAGGDVLIPFHPDNDDVEAWDIKVTDKAGNYLYWRNLNLNAIHEIILEDDGVARVK